MEKPGKASEWLYHDVTAPSNVATEAGCCPCIVYGRSNLRLKTASDKRRGRDITERPAYEWAKPPTYPLMSAHCCAFASCLPLYGVFLASLRGQIRHFYGIQGSDSEDFKVGCCCPADTATQIENEIILREGKRRQDSDGTITSGYQTPTPMTSPSSSSSSSRTTTRPDTPDTECDDPLPCIPEDSEGSTCPPTAVSSRRPSTGKGRERSIARDPMAPTDATLVHNHDLDRDPRGPVLYKPDTNHGLKDDPSSVMYPPAIHRLSKDTKSPAGPAIIHRLRDDKSPATPPAVDRSHELFHDAKETRPQPVQPHGIERDPVESFRPHRASESSEDTLRQPSAPRPTPASSSHHLQQDVAAPPTEGSSLPHILEADETMSDRPASRGPHHLQHDT
ncbi:hypothetical protein FDECE_18057 [Fusarium decemcellulare]|nr:hypothetical protein FDECE_18057 [Fusarium decemcellulare]